ncbi:MIP/aquaporin family protein [Hymenobacter edaphi]|uniref:Aquaporin family protein n=1 Tax=Hymenobacter edaphi TaxID=2211146 RepID=A0A328B6X7_9BACT|nr:aquaporin [Hymenobacter edaphi]RAK62385.1 aquaporin family protein [Hymenobacter edaphi]
MPVANRFLLAWRRHWPHYLAEALGLSFFVGCSGLLTMLVEHPASPVHQALPSSALLRRAVLGLGVGLVLVLIVYSPWGKRSGAHINPAVTLAFWQLGKIRAADAGWYVLAQVAGALGTAQLLKYGFGPLYSHPAVNYTVNQPATPTLSGTAVAFAAEFAISFLMMMTALVALHSARLKDWTGWLLGGLLAAFVCFEAPLSGMSMNPARTLGTAVAAGSYHGLWLYWLAPGLAMWLATALFRRIHFGVPRAGSAANGAAQKSAAVEPPLYPTDQPE